MIPISTSNMTRKDHSSRNGPHRRRHLPLHGCWSPLRTLQSCRRATYLRSNILPKAEMLRRIRRATLHSNIPRRLIHHPHAHAPQSVAHCESLGCWCRHRYRFDASRLFLVHSALAKSQVIIYHFLTKRGHSRFRTLPLQSNCGTCVGLVLGFATCGICVVTD